VLLAAAPALLAASLQVAGPAIRWPPGWNLLPGLAVVPRLLGPSSQRSLMVACWPAACTW
jgi:hypothetical protein